MQSSIDIDHICNALSDLESSLVLTFHPGEEESSFGSELVGIATRIEDGVGSAVTVKYGDGAGLVAKPGLTLSGRGQHNIHYLAVPGGLESPPFVEALLGLSEGTSKGPTGQLSDQLKDLERPADLFVFVAPTCPHCPEAARAANRIALANPQVTTTVIDVQQFPELARKFNVKSVPLTILDTELFLTGVVPATELAGKILSRGSDEYHARLFVSLIEEGRVSQAVSRILSGGSLKYFLKAWKGSTTSLRIGLVLMAEEVLEEDRSAMDSIVKELMGELGSDDAAMRGDTADLLGRIGHSSAAQALEALKGDSNPDVVEIAVEALEEIDERCDS